MYIEYKYNQVVSDVMNFVKSIFKNLWVPNKNKREIRTMCILNITTMDICLLYDEECFVGFIYYERQQKRNTYYVYIGYNYNECLFVI